jgi:dipeptidyl-peptidase-3
MSELSPGDYDSDPNHPLTYRLTVKPIGSCGRPGQTWKLVFADLANPVEECRATLVSYYFPTERDILTLFGYDDQEAAEERDSPAARWPAILFTTTDLARLQSSTTCT